MKKQWIVLVSLVSAVAMANPAPVSDISRSRGAAPAAGSGSLEQRLEALERVVEARGNAQMRMQQHLEQLLDEVSELRGQTELHSHQLEEIVQRQRDIYQEIERRMSAGPAPAQMQIETSIDPVQTPFSSDVSENDAYDRAVQMVLRDRRYDAAITEFERFLQNYPNSVYAANANYWLGELVLRDNELSKAKTYFQRVVQNFADSNKVPDALFKLGQVAERENNVAAARQYYQRVVEQHPNAPAVRLAQGRLDSLN
ncbi:MAG: tol-pal system protein YbgF [Alkalimonas sp.]|uniref:Cell division coordinator CpoB n=1 Tax=Alkalimonas delamerensis TaxID=265981 RepID=A0ABT9GRH1_9GAMM|nr:tol-pal system protein YbgF [Alkalimonas delamerensis]MCC5853010.1 tol-pal system protein YbgF [Alkalimonas sp.]MDP4529534.1 tol-pal system protein YbgF [Alkalimonas delamerensis]